MKSFIKNVFANIVALCIIGFVGILVFIISIAVLSSGKDSSIEVTENSVLTLDSKINIIDSPTEDTQSFMNLKDDVTNIIVLDILQAIKNAKTDDKIKGISIENDMLVAGITQIEDIRNALEDFKKSGKFVLAYGNTVSQSSYYLGSVAEQYYLHPAGSIDLKGLSSEVMFFKEFAEKYGIDIQVLRHGKYKAAVEPFLRNDLSTENKEQISTMLNDIWGVASKKMSQSRKLDIAQFQKIVDSLYTFIPENNIQYKIADKLLQKSEYDNILKKKLNLKETEKLNKVSFADYINANPNQEYSKNKIGVLYASGAINDGEGYDAIYGASFVKEIKKLANDDAIKAVVLRVNSPGGSANASDEILFELSELKKKKPLVVSFGDYAASGGYYIAMAADKIYSEPNTLTGSIGVFGVLPNIKPLANKNGIRTEAVNTNANSNMYSLTSGLTKDGELMMQKKIEQTYKRFVYFVTQNRKQSFEQIDAIAGGRVWSGTRAKSLGLVDELGSLEDAIKFAVSKAKINDFEIESYPKKLSPMEQIFGKLDKEEISTKLIKNKLGKDNYHIFELLTNPNNKNQILMESPYRVRW